MKNPYLNALLAFAYITALVFSINFIFNTVGENTLGLFAPIIMLTLFVLSAALMGIFFLYRPFRLYFDGQKDAALPFLLKTVGAFALLFALVVIIAFII